MWTILIFILILSFLVIIHELGHFLVARRNGIKVYEFGFGYPPKLWRLFRWRGTDFTLNAIPFGGFVRMEGEDFDPQAEETEVSPTAFYAKSAWSRLAVILAGPLANILFGVMAFCLIFSLVGVPRLLDDQPRIGEIATNSPADQAGIKPDFEIMGFRQGEEFTATAKASEVMAFVDSHQGEEVVVVLSGPCEADVCQERASEHPLRIRTQDETPQGEGLLGIVFANFYFLKEPWYLQLMHGVWYGVGNALALGWAIVVAVFNLFKNLLMSGRLPGEVAGPVGIVHQASDSRLIDQGFLPILEFTGMLSINLGIMNILPIPALDGGRILFIFLEKLFGKRRVQAVEGYIHYGGFILLLGLIILISIRDVTQLF